MYLHTAHKVKYVILFCFCYMIRLQIATRLHLGGVWMGTPIFILSCHHNYSKLQLHTLLMHVNTYSTALQYPCILKFYFTAARNIL